MNLIVRFNNNEKEYNICLFETFSSYFIRFQKTWYWVIMIFILLHAYNYNSKLWSNLVLYVKH